MRTKPLIAALLLAAASPVSPAGAADLGVCKFNFAALKFAGEPLEQAKCLLRPVKIGAELGEALASLPAPLDTLIGKPVAISKASLRTYLAARGISEADIGGSLDGTVSRARNNAAGAPLARYLVIHDTSSPNCSDRDSRCPELGKFPANMNEASWPFNTTRLIQRHPSGNPVAHMFVGRTGVSKTGIDFSRAVKAVKLESRGSGVAAGLFLHVENVQPRIGRPAIPAPGRRANDLIAPTPGFSDPQLERLAVIYVAASLRRGEWLIPVFHAVVDSGIPDAHDDPQNFDLDAWAAALRKVVGEIGGSA